MPTDVREFEFRFVPSYQRAAALFRIEPANCVILVGESLDVRFGPWHISTPLANIREVEVTGPYRFIKTGGPARLGLTDRGLTFASNGDRGVSFDFVEPITGFDPFGTIRHPNLTLTPDNCDALAALVRDRASLASR